MRREDIFQIQYKTYRGSFKTIKEGVAVWFGDYRVTKENGNLIFEDVRRNKYRLVLASGK